ncbi:T35 [Tupaiid betaherpesvirus 1]|uniref:T35 n=1 Tax=Tupaiid herpesvirus 1 (strain 1) TaxID=10397 RepID=Q91TQ7_TUHV1|nr:T35 [Tupaiid betaherpesvirus 1]AAK57080.1 T35 [Tupaiid betaherpesvirus 1]
MAREEPADGQIPEIPIDEHLNLIPGLLSAENIAYFRDELVTVPCGDYLGAVNSGLPMTVYELESLLHVQIRAQNTKCRTVMETLVRLTVTINHYYNSRRILELGVARVRQLGETNLDRLDAGYRRLHRALEGSDNPYHLVEDLTNTHLPLSRCQTHLHTLYRMCRQSRIETPEHLRDEYPVLGLFNHLYLAPLLTNREGIDLYAANLADLTQQRTQPPLRLWTAVQRTRDPEPVLNDLMFLLSLNATLARHREELRALRKWIVMQLSVFCSDLYLVYTQVPETRDTYRRLAREVLGFIDRFRPESTEDFLFAPVLALLFDFARQVQDADVYASPAFMRFASIIMIIRLYNAERGTRVTSGLDPDSEEEPGAGLEEESISSFMEARYLARNPYGSRDLFRCPRDLVGFLGRGFIRTTPTQEIMTGATEETVEFEHFQLDSQHRLILEGAARQVQMLPQQLERYLETVTTPLPVVEDTPPPSALLFADVNLRPIRFRPDGPRRRFRSVAGLRPYSVGRRPSGARASGVRASGPRASTAASSSAAGPGSPSGSESVSELHDLTERFRDAL